MSLSEARTYGLVGSTAQLLSFIFVIASLWLGQGASTISTNQITLSDIVLGFLGLVSFLGVVGAVESISKSFLDRSIVDSYVLSLAFAYAATGVSYYVGIVTPQNLWPIGQVSIGGEIPSGVPFASYVLFLSLVIIQFALLLFSFYRIAKTVGNRLFVLAGIVSVVGIVPQVMIGSYLFRFSPFFLVAAFLSLRNERAAKQHPAANWTDIPKGLVTGPSFSYSSLWFTEGAIFRTRPILANIKWVAFILVKAVQLVGPTSPTTVELALEDVASFALLAVFLLISRNRYPRFEPEEATKRAIETLSWEKVTRMTARGKLIKIQTQDKEYTTSLDHRHMGTFEALAHNKLGRAFESTD